MPNNTFREEIEREFDEIHRPNGVCVNCALGENCNFKKLINVCHDSHKRLCEKLVGEIQERMIMKYKGFALDESEKGFNEGLRIANQIIRGSINQILK